MNDDKNSDENLNQSEKLLLPIIVGPTGVGKTAVAVELCKLIDGEIISADSMQIYRGLDIGTAKATPEEQVLARHHLIDMLQPDEEYSAARWAQDARLAMEEIRRRGKQPVVVGGTGFYIAALLFPEHLASAPPDPQLRKELEALAAREGKEVLFARLQALDENAAARLHPNDTPRVMRAIEVALHQARQPASTVASTPARTHPGATASRRPSLPFVAFGLSSPREVLYERINARVEKMLEAGFMEELQRLIAAGYSDTAPLQNIGYKQMRPALEDATLFDECVALWKRDTRRYAKRQLTWLRHQLPVRWSDMSQSSPAQAAQEIAMQISPKGVAE